MDKDFIIKKLTPSPIRTLRRLIRDHHTQESFSELSMVEKFNKIYEENWWGRYRSDGKLDFDSGHTSYLDYMLDAYIEALSSLVNDYPNIKSVVDLGCGDFNVGKRISPLFESYTGVDIVEKLVERNNSIFASDAISFICKDITKDDLPRADMICVRQVLQHLSNADIANFLSKISGKYNYLVVTETMHRSWRFKPNKDIPTGPGVRFHKKSGVVLDAPPFSLRHIEKKVLCDPAIGKEYVVTILYKLH
tara:strand:+ start:156 stop:902 length:747 start_codon:yes stop_codon:yes gene_type:complete